MVQARRGPCLGFESADQLPFAGRTLIEELKSDSAAELQILPSVDHAHSAATKLRSNAVMRDDFAFCRKCRMRAPRVRCQLQRRTLKESVGLAVMPQKPFHFQPQVCIAETGIVQKCRPAVIPQVQCRLKNFINSSPALCLHVAPSY